MSSYPTWLNWATRQSWGRTGLTYLGYPTKIVLHSTETGTWPGYRDGASQPHLTISWDGTRHSVRQHQPLNIGARALAGPSGTNNGNAIQVEMIGTCDSSFARKYGYNYLPGLGDDYLKSLGEFIVRLAGEVDCPLHTASPFNHYPESYGVSASQRMSMDQWRKFNGVCGHQHVPYNDHGDPGNINVQKAIILALGSTGGAAAPKPTQKPSPSKKPAGKPGKLVVDGRWGEATTRALQRLIGTPVDGVISTPDSQLIRAMQRHFGTPVDGVISKPDSSLIRAMQKHYGTPVDGFVSPVSAMVKAMQRALNAGHI